MTGRRADPVEGEQGVKATEIRKLETANPGRIFYKMVFADARVDPRDVAAIRAFAEG